MPMTKNGKHTEVALYCNGATPFIKGTKLSNTHLLRVSNNTLYPELNVYYNDKYKILIHKEGDEYAGTYTPTINVCGGYWDSNFVFPYTKKPDYIYHLDSDEFDDVFGISYEELTSEISRTIDSNSYEGYHTGSQLQCKFLQFGTGNDYLVGELGVGEPNIRPISAHNFIADGLYGWEYNNIHMCWKFPGEPPKTAKAALDWWTK